MSLTKLLGGPGRSDTYESVFSTWATAHGHLACAYPPSNGAHVPLIPPLYPLLSAGIAALTGIGHSFPFPSGAALGSQCSTAISAMEHWSNQSGALVPTARIGYLSWLVLMAGSVTLLRAMGHGRRVLEPVVLVVMAAVPPVLMCLLTVFHPQDLLAMGLALASLSCVMRDRWAWAGVLLGLAVTSQQFALLVLAPILVMAPGSRRLRFIVATVAAITLIIAPLAVITSGHVIRAAVIGSGNTPSSGGTVLWELHFHGALLVLLSRILPIALSMALAQWAVRRLGLASLEPAPLISVIALSLSFRLVFEQNLFGYYFMALAVALAVLSVITPAIRGWTAAWVALVTLAFNLAPWNLPLTDGLPIALIAAGTIFVVRGAYHGHVRWYLVVWVLLIAAVFVKLPWRGAPFFHPLPIWAWQVVLVVIGMTLAAQPLLSSAHPLPADDSLRN